MTTALNRFATFLRTPAGFTVCLVIALVGVWLWREHQTHVLAALPLLLPLAVCLAMHVFMHGGQNTGD